MHVKLGRNHLSGRCLGREPAGLDGGPGPHNLPQSAGVGAARPADLAALLSRRH